MKNIPILFVILFLIVSIFSSSISVAVSSVVWNTTSNFNSGNKSGNYPIKTLYFADNGVDQPTYDYINIPTSIFIPSLQRTYVVWQATSGYLPYIIYYDHVNKLWSNPFQVANYNPIKGDGHGAPTLWIDSSGFIWVFWGAHHTAVQLYVSSNPYDITSWTNRSPATPHGTYPHLFEYNGYVYYLFRIANLTWTWEKSNDHGASWISGSTFLWDTSNFFYIYNTVLSGDKLYYNFIRVDQPTDVRRDNYVCYWNLLNNNQYGIDNSLIGQVVTNTSAGLHCRAVNMGNTIGWASNMILDSNNKPVIIYDMLRNGTINTWDIKSIHRLNSSWSNSTQIAITDGSSSYSSMFFKGNILYAFLTTGGFKDIAGDDYSGDLELWTTTNIGNSWSKNQTILTEAQAGYPVNRPYVPLNHNDEITVIFDTWDWRGLSTNLNLYAWGFNGFVPNFVTNIKSPVETNTDNNHQLSNTVSLWDGYGDTFSQYIPNEYTAKWRNIKTGDGVGTSWNRFDGSSFKITYNGTGSGSGRKGDSLIGNFNITGNFDIQVKFSGTFSSSGSVQETLCMLSEPNECDAVSGNNSFGANGIFYNFFNSPFNIFRAFNVSNGNPTQIGSDVVSACNPCWLRITKNSNFIIFYRSTDGVNWFTDVNYTFVSAPTVWYVSFSGFGNQVYSGSFTISIDNYKLNSGMANSYGIAGTWASPLIVYSNDFYVPTNINITFIGSSSTNYIGYVKVINKTNVVLYTYINILRFGTSLNIVISPLLDSLILSFRQDIRVLIYINGDGKSTFSINSVSVALSPIHTQEEIYVQTVTDGVTIMAFVSIVILFFLVVFWVRKYRGRLL